MIFLGKYVLASVFQVLYVVLVMMCIPLAVAWYILLGSMVLLDNATEYVMGEKYE